MSAARAKKAADASGPVELFTAKEAAERFLKVAPSWLEKRAARGQIPCHYVGRYLRFSRQDIAEIQQMSVQRPESERRSRLRTA